MIVRTDGRDPQCLYLGSVKTDDQPLDVMTPDFTYKARAWAPKTARSFTIADIVCTDTYRQYGGSLDRPLRRYTARITYYSTTAEGSTAL
jgi:hypothetical protein